MSKGSWRRRSQVPESVVAENWKHIFGEKKLNVVPESERLKLEAEKARLSRKLEHHPACGCGGCLSDCYAAGAEPFECRYCHGKNLQPDPAGYCTIAARDREGRDYFCMDCGDKRDRDRAASGEVPVNGHDRRDLHAESRNDADEEPSSWESEGIAGDKSEDAKSNTNLRGGDFWQGPGHRGEYTCPHGVGHGNHVHGCDGCCSRPDFPLGPRDSVKISSVPIDKRDEPRPPEHTVGDFWSSM